MALELDMLTCKPVISFGPKGEMRIIGDVTAVPAAMLDAVGGYVEQLGRKLDGYEEACECYDVLCRYAAAYLEGASPVAVPYERTCSVQPDGCVKVGVAPKVSPAQLLDEVCRICPPVAKDPDNISDCGMRLGFPGKYFEYGGKLFVSWEDKAALSGEGTASDPTCREFQDRSEWEASRAAAKLGKLLASA